MCYEFLGCVLSFIQTSVCSALTSLDIPLPLSPFSPWDLNFGNVKLYSAVSLRSLRFLFFFLYYYYYYSSYWVISVSLCSLILPFTCCRSDCKSHVSFCPHHWDQILPDEVVKRRKDLFWLMHFKSPARPDWEGMPAGV